jgi:hypothetical protein
MSSYIKATNFFTKDALLSGDPFKIIKGAEIDNEYNALAIAINSKADTTSPTFAGVPLSTTASAGTSTTQIATTSFVTTALQLLYPVGSIFSSTSLTNPSLIFGFGTWVAFGAGRVAIGAGGTFTGGGTGGSADAVIVSHTHVATVTDPGHNHTAETSRLNANGDPQGGDPSGVGTGQVATSTAFTGISVTNAPVGVSGVNANLPPYVVVYMWNRTV